MMDSGLLFTRNGGLKRSEFPDQEAFVHSWHFPKLEPAPKFDILLPSGSRWLNKAPGNGTPNYPTATSGLPRLQPASSATIHSLFRHSVSIHVPTVSSQVGLSLFLSACLFLLSPRHFNGASLLRFVSFPASLFRMMRLGSKVGGWPEWGGGAFWMNAREAPRGIRRTIDETECLPFFFFVCVCVMMSP